MVLTIAEICTFAGCEEALQAYLEETGESLLDVAFITQSLSQKKGQFNRDQLLLYAMYKAYLGEYFGAKGILAWALYRRGYVDEALAFLRTEALLELEESDEFSTDHSAADLAVMLAHECRFAEALQSLQRLKPDDQFSEAPVYYVLKGWCLLSMGKKAEALVAFQKAVASSQEEDERSILEAAVPDDIGSLRVNPYGIIERQQH